MDSSFQKCPLGKKCNLNDIFHARKGTFLPEKGHLEKLEGGAGPPYSYAPVAYINLKIFER
jgi:hypothetical protein